MNSRFRKYGCLTVMAVLVFATASFAGNTTITLTGVGDGVTVGDVYVDPYTGTVAGVGSNVPVICDDWSDNSYVGVTWTASVGSISGGVLTGSPLFDQGSPNQQTLYQEVAFLSTLLLQNSTNAADQAGISFAIWNLTYGLGPNTDPTTPLSVLNNNAGNQTTIAQDQAAYTWAMGQLASAISTNTLVADSYSFEILTPNPQGSSEPQEFLVRTPESSAAILFSADMIGLLALAFVFRRRLLLPVS